VDKITLPLFPPLFFFVFSPGKSPDEKSERMGGEGEEASARPKFDHHKTKNPKTSIESSLGFPLILGGVLPIIRGYLNPTKL